MENETSIKYSLPLPFLNKVEGKTTYTNIHEAHFKWRNNERSVYSDLGEGGNGLLVLFLRSSLFPILIILAFNSPNHPLYLQVIPDGDTGATTWELVRQHKVDNMQFEITKVCYDAPKQQILAALHNDYV